MKIELKILNKEFYRVDKMGGSYYDLPQYQTLGSAAMDLKCTEDVTLYPGERKMIPTGLAIWIGSHKRKAHKVNVDYFASPYSGSMSIAGFILPRSGLGTSGLVLANTIGLIDDDYQGELMISAWNSNSDSFLWDQKSDPEVMNIKAGDRIAQLLLTPIIKAQWDVVEEFSNVTERCENGFGSTN